MRPRGLHQKMGSIGIPCQHIHDSCVGKPALLACVDLQQHQAFALICVGKLSSVGRNHRGRDRVVNRVLGKLNRGQLLFGTG